MELNASDERGIDVVREKVKNFAQFSASTKPNEKMPPYKLIILDEADSMTNAAQTALRRTMETYSKVTRFCLICNYVSKIIEPLTSRCAKFRFKPLPEETMILRLKYICIKEGIYSEEMNDEDNEDIQKLDEEKLMQILKTIHTVSKGDLRKAITFLQSAHTFYGNQISSDAIEEIAGVVSEKIINSLFKACNSNSFDNLQKNVKNIISFAYPAPQVLSQLFDKILLSDELSDLQKSNCSIYLSQIDRRLLDGSDEYVQLLDAVAYIMKQIC